MFTGWFVKECQMVVVSFIYLDFLYQQMKMNLVLHNKAVLSLDALTNAIVTDAGSAVTLCK